MHGPAQFESPENNPHKPQVNNLIEVPQQVQFASSAQPKVATALKPTAEPRSAMLKSDRAVVSDFSFGEEQDEKSEMSDYDADRQCDSRRLSAV